MTEDDRVIRRRFRGPPLRCGVCGDPAKGYHFGGIACNSCTSFFRRYVRSETYESFTCVRGGNSCKMTGLLRKKCKSCRFAQCLRAGMETRWVPDEDERREIVEKKMWRQYSPAAQQQQLVVQRMYNPEPRNPRDCLSDSDHETLVLAVVLLRKIIQELPHEQIEQEYRQFVSDLPNMNLQIALCGGSLMRSLRFALCLSAVQKLPSPNDRKTLLKGNLFPMTAARVCFAYNPESWLWPREEAVEARGPTVDFRHWRPKMSIGLWNLNVRLIQKIHLLKMDEVCTTLFMIIQLLSSSGLHLEDESSVESLQTHFISILRKYVSWRFGSLDANIVFAKILSLLTDLNEIREYRNEANMWLDDCELSFLSKKLGEFNPFEDYSIERRNDEFLATTDDPYDLLHCKTPTVEMIRECMAEALVMAQRYNDDNDNLQESLFEFLEENMPLIQDMSSDDSNQSLQELDTDFTQFV